MPSQKDKSVKAKRRHNTRVKAKKQMKNWKSSIANFGRAIPPKNAELSLGHFAKNHALGCGRPKCGICHPYKKYGREESISEKRQKQKDKNED